MQRYAHLTVFDLDHTLLSTNSSYRFGLFLYQKKILPRAALLYALMVYAAHRYFALSLHTLHLSIFERCFKGMSIQVLRQAVECFLDASLGQMLYAPVWEKLQAAQAQGHYTVLLSNSPNFLVAPIAERLGFHEWASTYYRYDATGKLEKVMAILEGRSKAEYIMSRATRLGIGYREITAYSDSYLDLPLLHVVGAPIAVNPDAKLRQACQKYQWEIL